MSGPQFVLSLSCPDRPGIVAAVSTMLFDSGQNILDAQQFNDVETGRFFMRVVFTASGSELALADLRARFEEIATRFAMTFRLRDRSEPQRVMLLVSRFDHCLVDLI